MLTVRSRCRALGCARGGTGRPARCRDRPGRLGKVSWSAKDNSHAFWIRHTHNNKTHRSVPVSRRRQSRLCFFFSIKQLRLWIFRRRSVIVKCFFSQASIHSLMMASVILSDWMKRRFFSGFFSLACHIEIFGNPHTRHCPSRKLRNVNYGQQLILTLLDTQQCFCTTLYLVSMPLAGKTIAPLTQTVASIDVKCVCK